MLLSLIDFVKNTENTTNYLFNILYFFSSCHESVDIQPYYDTCLQYLYEIERDPDRENIFGNEFYDYYLQDDNVTTYNERESPVRSPLYPHTLIPGATEKEMQRLCDVMAAYRYVCSYRNVPIKLPPNCGK